MAKIATLSITIAEYAKYREKFYANKWFLSDFGDVEKGLAYSIHLCKGDPHCQP